MPGIGRLFDLGLTFQAPRFGRHAATKPVGEIIFGVHTPLWLDITPVEASLEIDLVTSLDYFSADAAQLLTDHARSAISALLAAPNDQLATIAERIGASVQVSWNV